MSQQHRSLSKYARHFFSGTLLSRVSGMLRDISMAALFGDHPSVAAFMVAFRFSHFLRRLLGEGALQSIFIPHYEELRLQDEKRASGFFFRLYMLLFLLLIAIVFVGESAMRFGLFQGEIARLFAWMFPSLIFICLYGLNISVLQCHNSFFSSSVAPFACNAIWIAAIYLFRGEEAPQAMIYLAISILVGFAVQWLLTLPKTWRVLKDGKKAFTGPFFSIPKEIRSVGKATLLGLIGITAVQINSFLDMLFARYADLKGPIYLWYAIRLEQLPLALIGFACVYSIVPSLSRAIKAGEKEKAQNLFAFGYKRILLLVIPCLFAIFALGFASVNLLFGRGQFSSNAVSQTTFCLWAYGLSLLPSTLTLYQSSQFYAYGDFKTPTAASLISVAANVLLNALFVFCFHWGPISIALSTTLSSCLNYWILKQQFPKKDHLQLGTSTHRSPFRLVLASSLALLACLCIDWVFLKTYDLRAFSEQALHFCTQLLTFTAFFVFGIFLLDKKILIAIKNYVSPEKALD